MSFESFGFSPQLERAIADAGYKTPTPIQAQAIPEVMSGKDVIGLAQTGTGKTAAFVLPLLQGLLNERHENGKGGGGRRLVRGLILAPTRELAEQIDQVVKQLGRGTGIRSAVIIGGVSQQRQVEQLRAGVDIVVACPGRLIDLYEQRIISFSAVCYFVLDEADQMFDMGFFPSIRRILGWLPKVRQSLLFSATMPSDISKLAEDTLKQPVKISVAHSKPLETVAHAVYPVSTDKKIDLLLALMPSLGYGSILVFTRTKHRAKRLGLQLERSGFRTTSLQGNLSQSRRKEAMDGFRKGKYQVMVATDIAARGIDVSEVTHVINFDIPDTADAYTHRIGRTGRAAKTGDALTLVTNEDIGLLRAIERHLGKGIERKQMEGFPIPGSFTQQAESHSGNGERRPPNRNGRSGPRNQSPRQSNGRYNDRRSNHRGARSSDRTGGGYRSFRGGRSDSSGAHSPSRSSERPQVTD